MPDSTGATVLDDLPELILIEEIFLRLPSRDVLRCRAVRRSWRSATCTRKFMLDHHARQPSLPIINHVRVIRKGIGTSRFLAFCHDAADRNLRPVIRCATPDIHNVTLHATLDGLLLVSRTRTERQDDRLFYLCNPATHQCAPLPGVEYYSNFNIVGFYKHHPSGEYRVLYFIINAMDDRSTYYVFTVGSVDDPRCIWSDWPPAPRASLEDALLDGLPCLSHNHGPPPVLQRGSLHWIVPVPPWDDRQPASDGVEIRDMVAFDTTGETFRWMRRPAQPGPWPLLFEVNGAMALCGTRDGTSRTDIEVWVMQDYDAGVWALIHQISFSPSRLQLDDSGDSRFVCQMVVLGEHELLISFPGCRLLRCNIDGGLLRDVVVLKCDDANNRHCAMELTLHFLQETILPFPFFEMQEEDDAYKEHPFILGM